MQRKHFLATLAGLALATTLPLAHAQDTKPLEWVVGYAAGGGSDIVARTIAESMSATLGRPIVINNKPGAGTNIAAEYSARNKDYGNLIFSADFATLAANPFLFSKLSYNAEKDFQPVGLLVRFPMFLVVSNNVPAKNLKEFMAWAKGQADGVNWASAGPGSPHHLVGELFREQSGLNLVHVPYRGAAPGVQDVVGGQIPAMWLDSASAYPFINGKKLKAIAVASPTRLSTLPDVPTVNEALGLNDYELVGWFGILAPAKTPQEVVLRLNAEINKLMREPSFLEVIRGAGGDPLGGTPAQFEARMRRDEARLSEVIRISGAKAN